MTGRTWLLLAAVTMVIGAISLGSQKDPGPSPLLQAMRNDPMGRYVPVGSKLANTDEQDFGSSLGKKFLLRYARHYDVPAKRAEAELLAAQQAARDAGWRDTGAPIRTDDELGKSTATLVEKNVLGSVSATLGIILITPPNAKPSTPRQLQLNITSANN